MPVRFAQLVGGHLSKNGRQRRMRSPLRRPELDKPRRAGAPISYRYCYELLRINRAIRNRLLAQCVMSSGARKEKTAASPDRSREAVSRAITGGMRDIWFFLVREPRSTVPHTCDKEESTYGYTIWAKIPQSTMCPARESVTLAAAGAVRHNEEM